MRIKLNHEITEEEFNKLPQLDRIEFRQKRDYLNNNRIDLNPLGLFQPMFIIIGFIMLIGLGLYNLNPESTYTLFNLIPLVVKLFAFLFGILLVLQIAEVIIFHKQKRLFIDSYFKQEIKVKGGNK